jgi:hypothetical protein
MKPLEERLIPLIAGARIGLVHGAHGAQCDVFVVFGGRCTCDYNARLDAAIAKMWAASLEEAVEAGHSWEKVYARREKDSWDWVDAAIAAAKRAPRG